ncbi:unnamed protein product [Dovyalis caffra]|uniref:Uncharacterized protein n=1 Tax=Dovyalis caffra TaxID=77055 RepID=A0AAV1R098_9ROSI|nr:unnamed protein product [Dovyalis caffra]
MAHQSDKKISNNTSESYLVDNNSHCSNHHVKVIGLEGRGRNNITLEVCEEFKFRFRRVESDFEFEKGSDTDLWRRERKINAYFDELKIVGDRIS